MAQGRGGYQRPSQPAASSGPGAASQRTDTGLASPSQIPIAPGQGYGDRAMQEGIVHAGGGGGGGTSGPQNGAPGGQSRMQGTPMAGPADDFYAPTQRPMEPPTAGIPYGPGSDGPLLPENDLEMLWAAQVAYPHNDLRRLLS